MPATGLHCFLHISVCVWGKLGALMCVHLVTGKQIFIHTVIQKMEQALRRILIVLEACCFASTNGGGPFFSER